MIKSPLRYPGGKNRAVKVIAPLIPRFKEFREPFLGGGSVFVNTKQQHPSKKYWINDIYKNLFLFWKYAQQNVEGLIGEILEFRSNFKEGKDLHKFLIANMAKFSEVEKAAAFFVFNRITFSGTCESGGFSEAAFNKRFTLSSIDRVRALSSVLDNVQITNLDYQQIIEAPGDDVFLFLDPPYYSATKSALYGKNGDLHKIFDHERFAQVLKDSKHKWLITYDDSDYVRGLFPFANIREWNLVYGMKNVNKFADKNGKELFISNFELCGEQQFVQGSIFDQVTIQ